MAEKKVKSDITENEVIEKEELNLEQKVTVVNIAGWNIGFTRINSVGDVAITPNGSTRLTRNEIISQVQNGNRLFTGVDGKGSHATIFINDSATREELGFDKPDEKIKQLVFNDKDIQKIFELKTQEAFENNIKKAIVTRAEKYAVIEAIKRLKVNDYSKIRFIEKYTGYKLD